MSMLDTGGRVMAGADEGVMAGAPPERGEGRGKGTLDCGVDMNARM